MKDTVKTTEIIEALKAEAYKMGEEYDKLQSKIERGATHDLLSERARISGKAEAIQTAMLIVWQVADK